MRAKFEFDDTLMSTHTIDDRRAEAARVEADRVAARQRELDAQREGASSPSERSGSGKGCMVCVYRETLRIPY
jgi:hypothetical protein